MRCYIRNVVFSVGLIAAAVVVIFDMHAIGQPIMKPEPVITIKPIPYKERLETLTKEFSLLSSLLPVPSRDIESEAKNPLLTPIDHFRASIANPSPTPLKLYHARTDLRHESGWELDYLSPLILSPYPLKATIIPPKDTMEFTTDLIGLPKDKKAFLPGSYTAKFVFGSPDSDAEYVSPPVTFSLTKDQIEEYKNKSP